MEKTSKEFIILEDKEEKIKNKKNIIDLTKDSFVYIDLVNTFVIFNSINDILYLIYSTKKNSIICYNLNQFKITSEIKNCHNEHITNIIHYLDKKSKRNLIMSISFEDNNIKLWNINNCECILNILHVNNIGFLPSACILNENNYNYIISSNCNYKNIFEPIKIFDFNGNKIKEINNSNDKTYIIIKFYDITSNKNFIITGNWDYAKSYDFSKNELYYKYYECNNKGHGQIIINNSEKIVKLIESCVDGNIRIWNFHSGLFLQKIKVSDKPIFDFCLWNNKYLFVGCKDKTIKIIEIEKKSIIYNLIGHNNIVLTIKRIFHPKYGQCLISQGNENDQIKLWTNIDYL